MKSTSSHFSTATPALKQYEKKRVHFSDEIKQYQLVIGASLFTLFFSVVAHASEWLDQYPDWVPVFVGGVSLGGLIYGGWNWYNAEKRFRKDVLGPAVNSLLKESGRDWKFLSSLKVSKDFIYSTNFFKFNPSTWFYC